MKNEIYNFKSKEVRVHLTRTLQAIQDTITSTLGPRGRNVILAEQGELPHITKDGVTVAEFLTFDDPFEEAINKIIKETARKTAEKVGDGTTTAILLATELIMRAMVAEDIFIEVDKIKADLVNVLAKIEERRIDLTTFSNAAVLDTLRSIVSISSNGDEKVIDTIMGILEDIGPTGLIDVVEGIGETTITKVQDGMLIDSTAHVYKSYDLDLPFIALVAGRINKVHEIKTLLQLANQQYLANKTPIVVIAKEFDKSVVEVVSFNNTRGKTRVFLVEVDGYANNMLDILDDMAMILGCKVLSTDSSSPFGLQNVTIDHLGEAKSATVTPQQTVIYPAIEISEEALQLKDKLEEDLDYLKSAGEARIGEIRQIEKRLTKFSKSAKIYVGGMTDAARKELKDRIDDAVQAIMSAVNHGVVFGGGYTLYGIGVEVEALGSSVLGTVCKLQAQKLNESVGDAFDLDEVFIKEGKVINFRTLEKIAPESMEVLDPADVLIKALEQAVAITEILLRGFGVISKVYD
jgi:chaperonin GroEL